MNQSDSASLNSFFRAYPTLKFKRRTRLVAPGETRYVYFLKRGYVRQYAHSFDGREFTLTLFKSGAFFPLAFTLMKLPNRYGCEALTAVEAVKVPTPDLVSYVEQHPEVKYDLLERVVRGLMAVTERMEHVIFGSGEQRVLYGLYQCAKYCGEKYNQGGVRVAVPLTHQDLASIVGLKRETVSRVVEQLLRGGIVAREKQHFIITSMQRFIRELCVEKLGVTAAMLGRVSSRTVDHKVS